MSDYGIRLKRENKIAIVTLDRPDRLNTFNEAMFHQLEIVTEVLKKEMPRVIIITGTGNRAFCTGFDVNPDNPQVSNLIEAVDKHDEAPVKKMISQLRKAVDGFISLLVPIIAAINGQAYGGGAELAVRCDLRIMDADAEICFSEIKLGLIPDWGGGPSLVNSIGSAKAAELILTGKKVDSKEALSIGLVNQISIPKGSLEDALKLADSIADKGPRAVRHALDVIRQTRNLPLDEALDFESKSAVSLIASGECIHGITAFLEKRKPEFPDIE